MKKVSMMINIDGENFVLEGTMMPFGLTNTVPEVPPAKTPSSTSKKNKPTVYKAYNGRQIREPENTEALAAAKKYVKEHPIVNQTQLTEDLGISVHGMVHILKFLGLVEAWHTKGITGDHIVIRYNPSIYNHAEVVALSKELGYIL